MDLEDIMYTVPLGLQSDLPSNTNPRDEALLCVTDLEDCCGTEPSSSTVRSVHGDWHFPDGSRIGFGGSGAVFQANRGANEEISEQTVYGSVRLYHRYSAPPERGRFYCELPSAVNPSVNQILYANICEFIRLSLCI